MLYIQLMRPKHYIKNILVFVCLICDGNLFTPVFFRCFAGFVAFSLLSSFVYITNDIFDADADKHHEIKKYRPVASGAITKRNAFLFSVILLLISGIIIFVTHFWGGIQALSLAITYLIVNLGYSLGLKHIPILDIVLLVAGFMLRVSYGAVIVNSSVSSWVYLTVLSLSFYLGLGKRRNELRKTERNTGKSYGITRKVLASYNYDFLDKFMYVCLTLSVAFYALWSTDTKIIARYGTDKLVWTVPLLIVITMKYSYDIEMGSYGDPVDVITGDKWLMLLIGTFALFLTGLIYL